MNRTLGAMIDEQGNVRLPATVHLPTARRALVTNLDDAPGGAVHESALLSEQALAEDWNRPKEEAAWSHV